METQIDNEIEVKEFPTPKLDALEKLYVQAYLHKLSHSYAHSVVSPGINHPKNDNPYSRRASVQFHISRALQNKSESLSLSPEVIIEKLYKEALREDPSASSSTRIQALQLLGKHLGMFVEKKEVEQFTFNIINYSSDSPKIEEEKVVEQIEENGEINGISFITYSEESNGYSDS